MASFSYTLTPTVGTAAYIAGDAIGGILIVPLGLALSSTVPVEVESIYISDKSKVHPAMFIEFFKATPTSGTYTDGSPLVYGSGDHANSIGNISVLAADWVDMPRVTATASRVSINDLGMVVNGTSQNIYILVHADSAFSLTALDWTVTVSGRTL
jgi:hypothetical protein